MSKGPMIIAVDFDGTLVEHEYPRIGKEVPYAVAVLKKAQEKGAKLILHTMRCDLSLDQAIEWANERDLHFWGINENPGQKHWTASPKVYATVYVDDAAAGCPLVYPAEGRPYVDWIEVAKFLNISKDEICQTSTL